MTESQEGVTVDWEGGSRDPSRVMEVVSFLICVVVTEVSPLSSKLRVCALCVPCCMYFLK